MVALSIVGSAWWRPERISRETLELGAATPVDLDTRDAHETIAGVLDEVAPTVAFLTIPDAARSGSGVVVHEAGFVVTNAHVVEDAGTVNVSFDDGSEYEGTVYGVDTSTDLAVVKIDAGRPMPVASLGDSDALKVGEFVLALGAPFGLQATATSGIVSGLHRSGLGIAQFEDFIVTDAPINSGNSGGPLVNLKGQVVGINTAIIAGENNGRRGTGTFAGVGFAIPVNVMRVVAQRLIGDGGLVPASSGNDGNGPVADSAKAPGTMTVANRSFSGQSVAMVQGFDNDGATSGIGSGFVIATDQGDLLVTNEHVVSGARNLNVFFHQDSSRGYRRVAAAEVLVVDTRLDLALVRLTDGDTGVAIPRGDPGALRVGSRVTAVGARNQGGRVDAVEIHGTVLELDVELQALAADAYIVATDLATERGDSGGPLLDESGRVVGVMVARDAEDVAERRAYAILLRPGVEIEELIQKALDPGLEPGFDRVYPPGRSYILVANVQDGGFGEQIGLERFDRIVEIDGVVLPENERERNRIWDEFVKTPPGTEVLMVVTRDVDEAERERVEIRFTVPERAPSP